MTEPKPTTPQKDTGKKAPTCEPVPYALTGRAEMWEVARRRGVRL